MPRPETPTLDRIFAEEYEPAAKVKLLLKDRYVDLGKWFDRRGISREHGYQTLEGKRRGESVRDALAEEFGAPREEIDAILDAVRPVGLRAARREREGKEVDDAA